MDEGRPEEVEHGLFVHRDSTALEDSGRSSVQTHSIDSPLGITDSITPRPLHKVASTTFQSFSDTIRSKARIFYVSPKRAESHSTDYMEDTPNNHQPRASISSMWSYSARNRRGRGSLEDRLELGRSSPTSMGLINSDQETTPTINVKIPSSFLEGFELAEDDTVRSSAQVSTAMRKPYEARQLWPSPISVALQQLSKIDLTVVRVSRSPMIDDLRADSSEDFMYDSAMFDPGSHVPPNSPEDKSSTIEGPSKNADSQSQEKTTETKTQLPASDFVPRSMSNKATAFKRQQFDDSVFFKGGHPHIHFQDIHDKSSTLTEGQREARDTLAASGASNSTQVSHINSSLVQQETETSNEVQSLSIPRSISHTSDSIDLVGLSDNSNAAETKDESTCQPSSSVYEAVEESVAPSPEMPTMGSRCKWEQSRADRYNRYSAIRSLDDDEKTEKDSEFGLELERSPGRKLPQDTLGSIAGPNTIKKDQASALGNPNDASASPGEETAELPPETVLHAVESKVQYLSSINSSQPDGTVSGLVPNNLMRELETLGQDYFEPSKMGHSVTVEAARDKLDKRNQEWSSISSYDSEDEIYFLHEIPNVTSNSQVTSTSSMNGQKHMSRITIQVDPRYSSSKGAIEYDAAVRDHKETSRCDSSPEETNLVWSRLSKMDESRSTEYLKAHVYHGNDQYSRSILLKDEYSPLDENRLYLNPRPFPGLNRHHEQSHTPSSILTEPSLVDQVDRLALLALQEAHSAPESPISPADAFTGFWADLRQDLKENIIDCQTEELRAGNQEEQNHKETLHRVEDVLKELEEMKLSKYELDDPDRPFNAARLPGFNSSALIEKERLSRIPRNDLEEVLPGPACDFKAVDVINAQETARQISALALLTDSQINYDCTPRTGSDQNSPGKKGVWWADEVEYIDKPSHYLAGKNDENKQRIRQVKTPLSSPGGNYRRTSRMGFIG